MIEETKGLVLNKIKYGDSSQIIKVFTRDFGLQSYMVKGIGKSKSAQAKASLLHSASLLHLSVYHHEQKQLKYLKEVSSAYPFMSIGVNILKNSVALFTMEVLRNFLTKGDAQKELFAFCEGFLIELDQVSVKDLANYPLYFLIQAGGLSGYQLFGQYDGHPNCYLDVKEGRFAFSASPTYLPGQIKTKEHLAMMSQLNRLSQLTEVKKLKISHKLRSQIMNDFLLFFEYHAPQFKPLKSLPILATILS